MSICKTLLMGKTKACVHGWPEASVQCRDGEFAYLLHIAELLIYRTVNKLFVEPLVLVLDFENVPDRLKDYSKGGDCPNSAAMLATVDDACTALSEWLDKPTVQHMALAGKTQTKTGTAREKIELLLKNECKNAAEACVLVYLQCNAMDPSQKPQFVLHIDAIYARDFHIIEGLLCLLLCVAFNVLFVQ